MCHRPMYCSNSNDPEHCTNKENTVRTYHLFLTIIIQTQTVVCLTKFNVLQATTVLLNNHLV